MRSGCGNRTNDEKIEKGGRKDSEGLEIRNWGRTCFHHIPDPAVHATLEQINFGEDHLVV